MKSLLASNLVAAIDIGTTKICVLIGHKIADGHVDIIGIGKVPSDGLKKGVVVDIAKAAFSIQQAIKEAELMAEISIENVVVGVSGAHIASYNSYGAVPLPKGRVEQKDIDAAIAAAKAIPLKEGQQILHVLPQYFSIDGQEKITNPLEMHGIKLEVQVHIITGAVSSVQNLVQCCKMAGVTVTDVVLEQLASARAVLSKDEQELGVAVLDIGGGTSDLALYQKGTIRHSFVVPVAGNHFTSDLAIGLRTTVNDAERIKQEYGLATYDLLKQDGQIEVEMIQGGQITMVSQSDLIDILGPRLEELLSIVHEEILHRHLEAILVSGMVITGGGSLLKGVQEVAQELFDVPVRIGVPHLIQDEPSILDNPMYATGYGLLLHATDKQKNVTEHKDGGLKLFSRMKSWVSDFF